MAILTKQINTYLIKLLTLLLILLKLLLILPILDKPLTPLLLTLHNQQQHLTQLILDKLRTQPLLILLQLRQTPMLILLLNTMLLQFNNKAIQRQAMYLLKVLIQFIPHHQPLLLQTQILILLILIKLM